MANERQPLLSSSRYKKSLGSIAQCCLDPRAERPHGITPQLPQRSNVAMLEVMAARLGTVAARAHVAPAPRCIPALIEKEPATGCVGAPAHAAGSRGNDEVGGGPKHGSQQFGR